MPFATPEAAFQAIQEKIAYAYHGKKKAGLVLKPFAINKGQVPDGFNKASEITLNRDIQAFSPFLKYINILPRKHQKGGSLMIGSQGRVTRTNDTYAGTERRLGKPKASKLNEYEMVKAHSDFVLHDDDIDSMSEFPNWADLYRQGFLESMGNDRIIIGWWGEEHALTSDISTNPLLQDVNTGWFPQLEDRASSQVLIADEIKIGKGEGNDYASVDHLVQDLYQGIPLHRRTPGMSAMIPETILGFAEGTYYRDQAGTPTEKLHIKEKAITGIYGGLEAIPAPYMPQTAIVITGLKRNGRSHSNLSIYWQKDSWRRSTEYKAKLESSIDWNARREAYHIEDLQAIVALKANKIIFTDLGKDDDGKWIGEISMIPEGNWAEV